MMAPCSNGISGGSLKTLRARRLMYSAKPPSQYLPIILPEVQNCSVPLLQYSQCPQVTI